MTEDFISLLRCPIDPRREATLSRVEQALICSGCKAAFPIKNGLPILIADEADLPPGVESLSQLHCVKESRGGKR